MNFKYIAILLIAMIGLVSCDKTVGECYDPDTGEQYSC